MVSIEEIKNDINSKLVISNIDGFCVIRGTDLIVFFIGQLNLVNVAMYPINTYTEISTGVVEGFGGLLKIVYPYS
jgi:hypothetical protein